MNGANGATTLNGKVGGTLLHEYGHNLGLRHAYTIDCGLSAIKTIGCGQSEYNDPADVMGRSSGYGHYNAVNKELLGWLGGGRLQTVTSSGSYTLGRYEASGGTKALKLPRTRDENGNATTHYYLEYRAPTGSWRNYATNLPNYDSGLLLHISAPDGSSVHSQLVDTRPRSVTNNETTGTALPSDPDDAPLRAGQTYADPTASLTVTVNSAAGASAVVDVDVDPATLLLGTTTAAPGAAVPVTFAGAHSPHTEDRLGLFHAGAPDNTTLAHKFLNCTFSVPTTPVSSGTCDFTMPTTSGQYDIRLVSGVTKSVVARSQAIDLVGAVVATPTRTRTATRTPSRTPTITPTRTPSQTRTITPTHTRTLTRTITPTRTITLTRTISPTRTRTITRTITPTRTPSLTRTITPTRTRTLTRTITPTRTRTLTRTITPTRTHTLTRTITPTRTITITRTPSQTRTVTATRTMTRTRTVTPTRTPTPAISLSASTSSLSAGTSVTTTRALWAPASTLLRLAPGERATIAASVSVTAPVDAPAFRVSSPGAVTIDPSLAAGAARAGPALPAAAGCDHAQGRPPRPRPCRCCGRVARQSAAAW